MPLAVTASAQPARQGDATGSTLGDSNSSFFAITGPLLPLDCSVIRIAFPAAGNTTSASVNGDKMQTSSAYPRARMIGCGGIAGDSTSDILNRSNAAPSNSRKSIGDVVALGAGFIDIAAGVNDLLALAAPISQASLDAIAARKLQILQACGSAKVIDQGILGYSPPSGNASDIAARRAGAVYLNGLTAAMCASSGGQWAFLNPVGVTCDDTGAFLAGMCETTLGVHLSIEGRIAHELEKAKMLTQWFGLARLPRYPGHSILSAASSMLSSASQSYGSVATGATISATNCTRQNARLENFRGIQGQACEFVVTDTGATGTIALPFTPSAYGVEAGQVLGFEFPWRLEGVGGVPPLPTALNAQLKLTKTGAGTISVGALPLAYPRSFTGSVVWGNAVFQPFEFPEASSALDDSNSALNFLFSTDAGSGTFRLWAGVPRAVIRSNDGSA